jgi:3-hydroxyisobutyrate dehydrogenase-like beta-hydroxyacid dehydrogenase
MRVGFLGTGIMGGAIAARILAAGHTLVVYDPRPEAASQLLESGAELAESPAAVARTTEVVFASLPTSAASEAATLGPDGAFTAGSGARVYFDLTTNRPSLARRLAEAAAERGITMLDAPVSGGKVIARRGQLSILVGGDAETLEHYRPLLETFGSKIFHVGGVGMGNVAKLVNNITLIANMTVAMEGMVLGVKAGLNPDALHEIVRASSGNSFGWLAAAALLNTRDFTARVARLEIAYKDVHLALELARELNLPLPICTQVERLWLRALALGWGDDDMNGMIRLFEEPAGVEVRLSERPRI